MRVCPPPPWSVPCGPELGRCWSRCGCSTSTPARRSVTGRSRWPTPSDSALRTVRSLTPRLRPHETPQLPLRQSVRARSSELCRQSCATATDDFSARARSNRLNEISIGRGVHVAESPTVEIRTDQPYVAIPVKVRMEQLGAVVPPLTGQVFDWLGTRGISPAGPPFWRYILVDMDAELELETGVAIASRIEA